MKKQNEKVKSKEQREEKKRSITWNVMLKWKSGLIYERDENRMYPKLNKKPIKILSLLVQAVFLYLFFCFTSLFCSQFSVVYLR